MDAKEFYRKRLIELTPEGITKRINRIVDIEKQAQICEEYHQYKVKTLNLASIKVLVCHNGKCLAQFECECYSNNYDGCDKKQTEF